MPILKGAKTVWVGDEPWKSPDGKVTIWTIKLEIEGQRNTHSTMSKALATEGWTGDVEVYTNPKGKDYVRQAPKEEGSFGSNTQPAKYAPKDDHTQESIARSVALKAAVDYVGQNPKGYIEQNVITQAEIFLAWLQGSSESTSPKASNSPGEQTATTTTASGYDKFKQQGNQLRQDERDEFNDMRQSHNEPYPDYPGDM